MGLVFKSGQWELVAGGTGGFDLTAGAIGAELFRNSTSSVLTGSLLPPSGAVAHSKIFSARGIGGLTGPDSSKITVTSRVSNLLDLNDFSSGFTWAGWIKSDAAASNNNSTIFFSSEPDGDDAVTFRRSGLSDNLIFEYFSGTSTKGKVTTDSTPWTDGAWVHYALTFSNLNQLAIYKNGAAIQFDVNTDTGGSTPTNQTSHTFNTPIPSGDRLTFRMFGGDLKTPNFDGLTGEVFNIGFWNVALPSTAISVLYNNPDQDFKQSSGQYTEVNNLVFSCSFDQVAADGTNIAFTDRGITNRFFVSGSSKPS